MTAPVLASMGGPPLIVVDSADFDGTNDYITRGAGLTGAADSKTGILSFWLRLDGGDGSTQIILNGNSAVGGNSANEVFSVFRHSSNNLQIFGKNAAGLGRLHMQTSGTLLAGSAWNHVFAAWDLASIPAAGLYINGLSDESLTIYTDDSLDYTNADWAIGAYPGGTIKLNGVIAELYFAPGQWINPNIVANRRLWRSSSGKPVYLGPTGAGPTGTAPLVYQSLADGEAVANFATNRGTGGNFTITGTLDTASSSPSD